MGCDAILLVRARYDPDGEHAGSERVACGQPVDHDGVCDWGHPQGIHAAPSGFVPSVGNSCRPTITADEELESEAERWGIQIPPQPKAKPA